MKPLLQGHPPVQCDSESHVGLPSGALCSVCRLGRNIRPPAPPAECANGTFETTPCVRCDFKAATQESYRGLGCTDWAAMQWAMQSAAGKIGFEPAGLPEL